MVLIFQILVFSNCFRRNLTLHITYTSQCGREISSLMDIRRQINRLKAKLTHLTEYTVTLIVVFSLQTVLLPLFLMWLATRLIRQAPRLVWPAPTAGKAASPQAAPEAGPTTDERPKPPEINS